MRRAAIAGLIVLTMLGRSAQAATSREVQTAIDQAKSFLYSQINNDGTWETVARPLPAFDQYGKVNGGQWGGLTGLATYALLASGDSPRDPRLARAIRFLKTADFHGIYAIAMRAQVWP